MALEDMNSPETETEEIREAIRMEGERAIHGAGDEAAYDGDPLDSGKYVRASRDLLRRKIVLSDDLLKKRVAYLQQDNELKKHLPPNHRCCVAVIPCSLYGLPFSEDEVESGLHQANLIVEAVTDKTVRGFTLFNSDMFRMQPVEVQQNCVFEIGEYEIVDPKKPWMVSEDDRNRIIDLYTAKFKEAQKIFNG
jgi:hypothetical protein